MITYATVCSGIEAPSVAVEPLGWEPLWFAEIDPFCSSLLAHHYPNVPNYGDFTRITEDAERPAVLMGGTPCQSFSVAGRRAGLDDARGVLAFEFLRLVDRLRPDWFVYENVPGMLSSGDGRDFGAWLGSVVQIGYSCAWRVLDAQWFGVPQQRKRLFVVGHSGADWRYPFAVLQDSGSLCGHPAARREARERVTAAPQECFGVGGGDVARSVGSASGGSKFGSGQDSQESFIVTRDVAFSHTARGRVSQDRSAWSTGYVAHCIRSSGHDASEDGTGRGIPLLPVAQTIRRRLEASKGATGGKTPTVINPILEGMFVRQLTPREVERCFGFPDDYTLAPHKGKPMSDSRRYQMLGNSIAVPVLRWIAERIEMMAEVKERLG